MCFVLKGDPSEKRGQLAHLDRDRSNDQRDNLAYLCLDHHNDYDTVPSQTKGYAPQEVKQYRAMLIDAITNEGVDRVVSRPKKVSSKKDSDAEKQLRRDLRLRDRMRRDFIKPLTHEEWQRIRKPYERLRHPKVIVREVGDRTYGNPNSPPAETMSGWFRTEPYDFYFNGISVVVGLVPGLVGKGGAWMLAERGKRSDVPGFRPVQIWHLGRIPWRNIREYDPQGDEFYAEPHLHCLFSVDGMPYEDFAYAICGEEYDWPLAPEKRLSEAKASS